MSNNDENIIDFGNSLTVTEVSHYKDLLLAALMHANSITLKVDTIEKIDTSGIQLLLSFIKSANKKNISWHWQAPSLLLVNKARLLGTLDLLRLT